MTGSASQAMDVVYLFASRREDPREGVRGREGLGAGPRSEAGGFFQPIFFTVFAMLQELILRIKGSLAPTTSPRAPEELRKTLPRAPQEAPRAVKEAPRGPQRRSKSTKRGLIVS